MSESKVLSLEDVRARIQARAAEESDVSKLEPFEHSGLGGVVYYGPLPSRELHTYENVEQYYPLDHSDPTLRGVKASTPEMDNARRERILLKGGVRLADGKRLDDETIDWLLKHQLSGPDNRELILRILNKTTGTAGANQSELATVHAFTRWEAAFHDLLVKSGWVEYWVEYVTSSDTSTPEAKEAAEKLLKLEAAAPEWSRQLQAQEIVETLAREA